MRYQVTLVAVIALCAVIGSIQKKHYENFLGIDTYGLPALSSTWQTDEIPKIIHQMAPADKSKWHAIWHKCHATWQNQFSDFVHMMWTDEAIDDLIKSRVPSFYDAFKQYPANIYRFDAARYFILYFYGGIYADMDTECVKNFYNLLPRGKVSLSTNTPNITTIAVTDLAGAPYSNNLMASPAHHMFWDVVIDELRVRHKSSEQETMEVFGVTGPLMMAHAIKRCFDMGYTDIVNALPSDKFDGNTLETHNLKIDKLYDHTGHDRYVWNYGTMIWNQFPSQAV